MALRRDKNGNATDDSFISEAQDIARAKRAVDKEEKAARRVANAAARAKRTPEEQLAILDERLGKDIGATRERKKLLAEIKKSTPTS